MISLRDITFTINNKLILDNISFDIEKNSITQIFGPNGAGKTTLFKIISGIIHNYIGTVLIGKNNLKNHSVKKLAKQITFLPQFHHFSLPVSVRDILIAGRYPYASIFQPYTKEDNNIVENAVEDFNISDIIDRDAMTLSGGEIKKVMLASAFIQNVPIILLDEPFVSLDPLSALKLKELLITLNQKGKTIIVISHRMELMYPIATHLIAIDRGKINYSGKKKYDPELLRNTLGIDFKSYKQNNKEYIFIDG